MLLDYAAASPYFSTAVSYFLINRCFCLGTGLPGLSSVFQKGVFLQDLQRFVEGERFNRVAAAVDAGRSEERVVDRLFGRLDGGKEERRHGFVVQLRQLVITRRGE